MPKNVKITKTNESSKYMITFLVLLILANILLGYFVIRQSGIAITSLMQSRMLDISNTAAAIIDGDIVENINKDNLDSDEYNSILQTLRYFQDNIGLDYIYLIRDEGNNVFTFIIDPDYEDAAEYGEETIYTEALHNASLGRADIDTDAIADEWGAYYTAYSPVFNSQGKVVGIIGVDFAKEWFDAQLSVLIRTVAIVGAASLIIGICFILILTRNTRNNIKVLHNQLNELEENLEILMQEVSGISGMRIDNIHKNIDKSKINKYNVELLGNKVIEMQNILYEQIKEVQKLAFIDSLTGVCNKTSYTEKVNQLNSDITSSNEVKFTMIVFDLNGLKSINDEYGHEYGDLSLVCAADAISSVFPKSDIYRIGGDEFTVITMIPSIDEINQMLDDIDNTLQSTSIKCNDAEIFITLSKGYSCFNSESDKEVKEVFTRADKMLYINKSEFYKTHGDRRKA